MRPRAGGGQTSGLCCEHMFASTPKTHTRPALDPALAERIRPATSASSRLLPIDEGLAPLFPDGRCQRGWTVLVAAAAGQGGRSLAYAIASGPSRAGHWCAVVGAEDPGVAAAAELGLDLRRVVFVPVQTQQVALAAGDLLDGFELVVLASPRPPAPALARRLAARARERRSVLVVVGEDASVWPEADLTLSVTESAWQGVARGHGRLTARRATVRSSARRGPTRSSSRALWLPSRSGEVRPLGGEAS